MSALAQNVNLMDEFNILRIICGAFYVPHIYAKFFVPEALGFFKAAGFKPAKPWMYFACVVEVFLATGLILGIFTVYVASLAALHLLISAVCVWKVTGGKWHWNIGGYEYCVFWAICCIVVAMHG